MTRLLAAVTIALAGCWDFASLGKLHPSPGVGGVASGDASTADPEAVADAGATDLAAPSFPAGDGAVASGARDLAVAAADLATPIEDFGPPDLAAVPTSTSFTPIPSGTNKALAGVWGSSSSNVWIVGDGFILHGGTGGFTGAWSGAQNLNAVWGASASAVWAVGAGGAVMRGSGGSWAPESSGTSATLQAVWGTSAGDVYAAGVGVILHSTGNGSWTTQYSDGNASLYGVHGSSSGDVWAVGVSSTATSANGLIVHGGGEGAWTPSLTATSEILQHVWATSASDVRIVGGLLSGGPRIYHLVQGAWVLEPQSGSGALFTMWGGPSGELYAAGYDGMMLRLVPGAAWRPLASATTDSLWSMWGSSSGDVWAVGDGGAIVHYP
jgi:hypothetical protein